MFLNTKIHSTMTRISTISLVLLAWLFGMNVYAQVSDPVMLFFNNAEKFRVQGNLKEAIEDYNHALAISDTASRIHYTKGLCHYQLKDYENAAKSFEKTVTLVPNNFQAYNALLRVYADVKDTDKMVGTLNRMSAAADKPDQKLDFKLRAVQTYIQLERYKDADPLAKEALKIKPEDNDVLYYNAQINNKMGNYELAKKDMEKVTTKVASVNDPKITAKYWYELGYSLHHLGQYDKADNAFVKADFGPFKALIAKLKPGYYYNVANCYYMIYDYTTAQSMLHTALKIDKSYAQANVLLADMAIKEEHHHKGIHFYKLALSEQQTPDKSHEKIYATLIETLINAKKYSEAITTADECLSKFPGNRNVMFMKAMSLYKENKNQDAVALMEEILKDSAISPIEKLQYSFALGTIYSSVGDVEKAKNALKEAGKGPFQNAAQYAYELLTEQEARAK
jgi:pentatricopeptide repeat protein